MAKKCEVQLAYAIGVAKPVSVRIDTFGTGRVPEKEISEAVCSLVDLRPAAIIARFDLRKPIYKELAAYGQMGREVIEETQAPDGYVKQEGKIVIPVKFEETDLVPALQKLCR